MAIEYGRELISKFKVFKLLFAAVFNNSIIATSYI